jgi:hypothetical protein
MESYLSNAGIVDESWLEHLPPGETCQFQHGGSFYGSHFFPLVIGHAIITRRDVIKSERLLFHFGQRRVADTTHRATDACRFKNPLADNFANLFSVFLLAN